MGKLKEERKRLKKEKMIAKGAASSSEYNKIKKKKRERQRKKKRLYNLTDLKAALQEVEDSFKSRKASRMKQKQQSRNKILVKEKKRMKKAMSELFKKEKDPE